MNTELVDLLIAAYVDLSQGVLKVFFSILNSLRLSSLWGIVLASLGCFGQLPWHLPSRRILSCFGLFVGHFGLFGFIQVCSGSVPFRVIQVPFMFDGPYGNWGEI